MIKTRVWAAKKGTVSLRSTIPETVVEVLGLTAGDELVWEVGKSKGAEQAVLVRKVRQD